MSNLDHLLHLAAVLGADAVWLLRGSEAAEVAYVSGGDEEATIVIHDRALGASHPVVFVARLPDDDRDWGLTELKIPPGSTDREIQLAALLSAALDQLTRIGPKTTLRVIEWLFARYGITGTGGGSLYLTARDRRPPSVVKAEPPAPPAPLPATAETARLIQPPSAGEQIRAERTLLGLAQAALAERAGLSQATLSAIERGKAEADAAVLERLREAIEAIRKEQAP